MAIQSSVSDIGVERIVKQEEVGVPALPFPTKTVLVYCGATLFTAIIFYVFIVQGGLAFDAIGVTSAKTLGRLIGIASLGVPVGALLFGWLSSRWPTGWVALLVGARLTRLSGNEAAAAQG